MKGGESAGQVDRAATRKAGTQTCAHRVTYFVGSAARGSGMIARAVDSQTRPQPLARLRFFIAPTATTEVDNSAVAAGHILRHYRHASA